MNETEAREITTGIQDSIEAIGTALSRIRDEHGYAVLGYDSFTEYLQQEISRYSRQHLYRLMSAATIEMRLSPLKYAWKYSHLLALGKFPDEYQFIIAETAISHAAACNQKVTASIIDTVGIVLLEAARTGCVDTGDGTSTPITSAVTAEAIEKQKRQLEHIQNSAKRAILVNKQPARVFGRTLQFPVQFELPDATEVLVTIYEVGNERAN